MATVTHGTLPVAGVDAARACACWAIINGASLEEAARPALADLLREDPGSACAFMSVRSADGVVRSFGRGRDGGMLQDVSFRLNHRALRRALAGEDAFAAGGMHDGEALGPEAFAAADLCDGGRVVFSVRRPIGAAGYGARECAALNASLRALARAIECVTVRERYVRAPAAAPDGDSYHGLCCRSPAMRELCATIEKIKDTDFSVCIAGESGSGKELVARALHAAGRRAEKPFVAESCGSVVESLVESELFGHAKGAFTGAHEAKDGLFVRADGGTLFLDEIGDMSPVMQAKVLRAIQEGEARPVGSDHARKFDVRIIASSLHDLEQMVAEGGFRSDLYWRLNVIGLKVPPLRERKEDLPELVRETLGRLGGEGVRVRPLSESALRAMAEYHWPGNVRQLASVLRRVMVACEGREVGKKEFQAQVAREGASQWRGDGLVRDESGISLRIPARGSFKAQVAECEKAILLNALREHRWNKSRVTRALKIPRQSLYNKLAEHGLAEREGPDA
ncbi:MAG TPA: two-component system response regulator [Planctomycetes bacterium]|nr:two-component system response regulator [Planctomycetota bacterium]